MMRVVFEKIVSCRMKEALTSLSDREMRRKIHRCLYEGLKLTRNFQMISARITLLLLSILLRGHYGGTACDMLMLVRYVKEWRYSFNETRVPVNISNRINERLRDNASFLKQNKTNKRMNWEEFTCLLHSKSNLRSAVSSLTIYGTQSCSLKALSLSLYFGRYCI